MTISLKILSSYYQKLKLVSLLWESFHPYELQVKPLYVNFLLASGSFKEVELAWKYYDKDEASSSSTDSLYLPYHTHV